MPNKTITFRMPEETLQALDSTAQAHQRDRSFILNEAVANYLALEQYNLEMIEEGIRDDDAGRTIPHEEVCRRMAERIRIAEAQ